MVRFVASRKKRKSPDKTGENRGKKARRAGRAKGAQERSKNASTSKTNKKVLANQAVPLLNKNQRNGLQRLAELEKKERLGVELSNKDLKIRFRNCKLRVRDIDRWIREKFKVPKSMHSERTKLLRIMRGMARVDEGFTKELVSFKEDTKQAEQEWILAEKQRALDEEAEMAEEAEMIADEEEEKEEANNKFIDSHGLGGLFRKRAKGHSVAAILQEAQEKSDQYLAKTYEGFPDQHVEIEEDGRRILQLRRIQFEGQDGEDEPETWKMYFGPEGNGGRVLRRGNPEYIKYCFGESFYNYCLRIAKRRLELDPEDKASFLIPCWDSNSDVAPLSCLMKYDENGQPRRKLPFQQGDLNYCMAYCVANALHFLGWHDQGNSLASKAEGISVKDSGKQVREICDFVNRRVPGLSPLPKQNGFQKLEGADVCVSKLKLEVEFAVIVLEGNDGAISHAIAYTKEMIFDSTQLYPLSLTKETLDFVCGEMGFCKVFMARTFKFNN